MVLHGKYHGVTWCFTARCLVAFHEMHHGIAMALPDSIAT